MKPDYVDMLIFGVFLWIMALGAVIVLCIQALVVPDCASRVTVCAGDAGLPATCEPVCESLCAEPTPGDPR